jgi:tetratricopeptide (TPR) repeat protein
MSKYLLMLLFVSASLLADNCDDILTAAELSITAGNLNLALEMTEQSDCMEDYAFVMNAGYLFYKNNRYVDAVKYYEIAAELSGGNKDSMLMLGWARYYAGDYFKSLHSFNNVLNLDEENESAKQGLLWATVAKSSKSRIGNYVTKHFYSNDLYKKSAVGLTSNISFSVCPDVIVNATRRRTVFDVNTLAEMGFGDIESSSTMIQQEYWWSIASYGTTGSARVVFGGYENNSNWNEIGSVVGLEIEKHRFKITGIYSDYDDGIYSQYNLQAKVFETKNIKAEVFISCQDASRKLEWSFGSNLHSSYNNWSLDISTRGGNEVRPVYLIENSVYNVKSTIKSSGNMNISRELFLGSIMIGAEYQSVVSPEYLRWNYESNQFDENPTEKSNTWLVTIGLTFEM